MTHVPYLKSTKMMMISAKMAASRLRIIKSMLFGRAGWRMLDKTISQYTVSILQSSKNCYKVRFCDSCLGLGLNITVFSDQCYIIIES